jgi:hypothetical protein
MPIAGKSHSQRDVLACSRRLRSSLFSVMLRLPLLSSPILASSLSFPVLGKYRILFLIFLIYFKKFLFRCLHVFLSCYVCLYVLCFCEDFLCLDWYIQFDSFCISFFLNFEQKFSHLKWSSRSRFYELYNNIGFLNLSPHTVAFLFSNFLFGLSVDFAEVY